MLLHILLALVLIAVGKTNGVVYRSTIRTHSALSDSFDTEGTYNIQLAFHSNGELFLEVVKEPVLPKERMIYVRCLNNTFIITNWSSYQFNEVHNYRKLLGTFPHLYEIRCSIAINSKFRTLVARRNPTRNNTQANPIREELKIIPIPVSDTLNGSYEWTFAPLYENAACQEELQKISCFPPMPNIYKESIAQLIRGKKVFLSLTTTPGRLSKLHYTLKSLCLDRVETIFITLPKKYNNRDKYVIPYKLVQMFPNIQFLSASIDIGPALKAVGAAMYLQRLSLHDSILISIDDDNVYGPAMIDTFVYFSLRHPKAAFTATELSHITTFGFPPVLPVRDPLVKSCYVLEGFVGYASRVGNFDVELISALVRRDMNPALSDCYLSDDVVISFVLAYSGIKLASTMVPNTPMYTGLQRKELVYFKDEYALHLRNSDESRSVTVTNDNKYNSAIETIAKFALDRNDDSMKFARRQKILRRLRKSYAT